MWPPRQFHEPILQRRGKELDVAASLDRVEVGLAIRTIGPGRLRSDADRR
jgi:hypothetical protein